MPWFVVPSVPYIKNAGCAVYNKLWASRAIIHLVVEQRHVPSRPHPIHSYKGGVSVIQADWIETSVNTINLYKIYQTQFSSDISQGSTINTGLLSLSDPNYRNFRLELDLHGALQPWVRVDLRIYSIRITLSPLFRASELRFRIHEIFAKPKFSNDATMERDETCSLLVL